MQRRNGAKKTLRNAAALCAFAPLREKSSSCPKIAFERIRAIRG
jgi:hypothetical protein